MGSHFIGARRSDLFKVLDRSILGRNWGGKTCTATTIPSLRTRTTAIVRFLVQYRPYLIDLDIDEGPLWVVPGSHRIDLSQRRVDLELAGDARDGATTALETFLQRTRMADHQLPDHVEQELRAAGSLTRRGDHRGR